MPGKEGKKISPLKGCGIIAGALFLIGFIASGIDSCNGGAPRTAQQPVSAAVKTPAQKGQQAWTHLAQSVFGERLHEAEWIALGETKEGAHSVWFKVGSSGRPGNVVGRAASQIHKFLTEAYKQKIVRDPKGVVFLVMVDLVDPYGNKSLEKVLNINFDGRDLRQVNWAGINEVLLLDLASVTPSNRVGGEILEDYCADPDHWQMTPKFCAKASK